MPNLVQGQTLAGDYGVMQSVDVRIVNNDKHNARQIAIYANPRGGRATGTFLIDRGRAVEDRATQFVSQSRTSTL